MKNLIKNKFIFLAFIVICVSLIYLGIKKLIDNYTFNNNYEIVSELESEDEGRDKEEYREILEDGNISENEGELSESLELISDEETSLVLEDVEENEVGEVNSENVQTEDKENDVNKILVHITGEVNNPGVVSLNEGSRIVDAINAGGGVTENADISKVNLAFVLYDGMKVNIPNAANLKEDSDFEYITMSSGDGKNDDNSSFVVKDFSDSNSSATSSSGYVSSSSKKYDVVNINSATQTELESLPGIGPSLALKIINYRKENGKFSSIDQIKNVSGIGESKFAELKFFITI